MLLGESFALGLALGIVEAPLRGMFSETGQTGSLVGKIASVPIEYLSRLYNRAKKNCVSNELEKQNSTNYSDAKESTLENSL